MLLTATCKAYPEANTFFAATRLSSSGVFRLSTASESSAKVPRARLAVRLAFALSEKLR